MNPWLTVWNDYFESIYPPKIYIKLEFKICIEVDKIVCKGYNVWLVVFSTLSQQSYSIKYNSNNPEHYFFKSSPSVLAINPPNLTINLLL